jgi:CTP-dependent riboflavin kinase
MMMIMNYRMFSQSAMALALFVAIAPAFADDNAKDAEVATEATHVGKVVSITGTKLVMTNKEGKEHSHALTADAKVSCDGKVCKAEDLKAGTKIRVTTQTNDAKSVTRIEAIDKNKSFLDTHDGEVVSITATKLVMTIKRGKEHSHTLTEDVKVTCDGEACKSSDLKPGMRIRVTSESETPHTVTQIEALDKNLKFASL